MLLGAPKVVRATALALGAALALAAASAGAQTKTDDKSKDAPAAKPELVGSYGDWSVFHSQSGKTRICYTLAQPKSRDPDDLKRDPGYAFISERPAEGVARPLLPPAADGAPRCGAWRLARRAGGVGVDPVDR